MHARIAAGLSVAMVVALGLPLAAQAQAPLGSAELTVHGVRLAVGAEAAISPIQVPARTGFTLSAQLVDGADRPLPASPFSEAVFATGELSGPGVCAAEGGVPACDAGSPGAAPCCAGAGVLDLGRVVPGAAPFVIPPLAQAGNYVVDNLRLIRADGTRVLDASPNVLALAALDKILVTQVSTRPLALEEMQQRGILVDAANFNAYECDPTLAVGQCGGLMQLTYVLLSQLDHRLYGRSDKWIDAGSLGPPSRRGRVR